MDLSISTLTLEAFLLVLVRCGTFLSTAPLFGHKSVNARTRVLVAFCIALAIFTVTDPAMPEYSTVFGFSLLIIKEAVIGLSLGFTATFVMEIITMAGEFIDREIGFTMSTSFDPSTGGMVTITAALYDKMVMLVIVLTNLHYYILKALAQSFELLPIGQVDVNYPYIYTNVIGFIGEYFSIGFRISMPVFLGATILNIILGVLAKSSPQMNMFAVGIQLKVTIGLLILSITAMFIPNIATYLMEKIQNMLTTLIGGM